VIYASRLAFAIGRGGRHQLSFRHSPVARDYPSRALNGVFQAGALRKAVEQSQRSGLKDVAESTAGIIPGDRGMAGGSWCRPPLQTALAE
jgi:hypothetical protein